MLIEIDDREPKVMLDLVRMEFRGKKDVHVRRKRLLIGDYECGDCVIERKTIDDFCGSVMDGRFKRQVENMKDFKYKFVLVSGHIKDRKSEIHENCILGKIISMVLKHGVNVLMLDDDIQMAYVIRRIFERVEENEK